MLPFINRPARGGASRGPRPSLSEPLVVEEVAHAWSPRGFSLVVARGERVALTGPSGSGKSLLLRLIADLDPGTGTARIGGLAREAVPATAWREMVMYVPADSGWWTSPVAAHMSDVERARPLLDELGLPQSLLEASPDSISSGERQRLALVRAVILRPCFLLLDEPTSALDPASTLKVEALLARLTREGVGLLLVSHDPGQIARMADRHYALSEAGLAEVAR